MENEQGTIPVENEQAPVVPVENEQEGVQAEKEHEDPIDFITSMLESKSTAKQTAYKYLQDAFSWLCTDSRRIIQEIQTKAHPTDKDVTLDFGVISKHEFHVKLAGDVLIFVLHTNVITFHDDHEVMKDEYILKSDVNRYFGQINIYNFMYDSLRYNRGHDSGYLIGRLMVNHENRFFMEGEPQLTEFYRNISREPLTEPDLKNIVKICLKIAIKNDLVAPPYSKVRSVTLHQKNEHTIELGGGQKIGFRMSYQLKAEAQ